MKNLQVPERLKGAWEHALFLTYGADLPFFEHTLWSQLPNRCRNRIVLADGRSYLRACQSYARRAVVRHLNQRYVAEGIFCGQAAHAKAILLTNSERGRLLVGSGNLSLQGYASGGELFTEYEYAVDTASDLGAFITLREFLEELVRQGSVRGTAERHLALLFEGSPWLTGGPESGPQSVRHNLEMAFIDQLRAAIGTEPVEEVEVLAPFYDEEALALERLLTEFQPLQTRLLMQQGQTSVAPEALRRILGNFGDRCQFHLCRHRGNDAYLHAKLYLFKLSNRAVCLQGSPNLSRVAMLRAGNHANLEIANLLIDQRDAFDYLLDALDVSGAVEIDDLQLSYEKDDRHDDPTSAEWYLATGELAGDLLRLGIRGHWPEFDQVILVIDGEEFALHPLKQAAHDFVVRVPSEGIERLSHPVPVQVKLGTDRKRIESNAIFVCNRSSLDAMLNVNDEVETLQGVADLDIELDDLERLFKELLDSVLVLDDRSLWRTSGGTGEPTLGNEDERIYIPYEEVNYDLLRRHPKIQQYLHSTARSIYAPSRLQIILSSITQHVRDVSAPVLPLSSLNEALADLDEDELEDQTPAETEDEGTRRQRRSSEQRLRSIIKNFLRRYFRGIESAEFRELVGYEIVVTNYVVVQHILWTLFSKEWMDAQTVIEALQEMWTFFWGGTEPHGYFDQLTSDQQMQAIERIDAQHADMELLASMYHSAYLARIGRWDDLRFRLRDTLRRVLLSPALVLTADVLLGASRLVRQVAPFNPPTPWDIALELEALANFETRKTFLKAILQRRGLPRGTARLERQTVRRKGLAQPAHVECLLLGASDVLNTVNGAVGVLQEWRRAEQLDYYRIQAEHGQALLYYDLKSQKAVYQSPEGNICPLDPETLSPVAAAWDDPLRQLRHASVQASETLMSEQVLAS